MYHTPIIVVLLCVSAFSLSFDSDTVTAMQDSTEKLNNVLNVDSVIAVEKVINKPLKTDLRDYQNSMRADGRIMMDTLAPGTPTDTTNYYYWLLQQDKHKQKRFLFRVSYVAVTYILAGICAGIYFKGD